MTYIRTITVIALTVILAALSGCNSKKEKAVQAPETKPGQVQTQLTSSRHSADHPAVIAVSPQDETDAAALSARILSQIKEGKFTTIFLEASEGFRKVGPEQQFVAFWKKQMEETGAFRDVSDAVRQVRPTDKFLVYTYIVQYEKMKKELRLTFGRSKAGKMELTGINQKEIK